ncbi:MAG: hypothetical protein ACLQVL_01295 [Terriglobia bacterium]
MKRLGMHLIALFVAMQFGVVIAQTTDKLAPTFALAIEAKPLEAENAPGTLILLVKYTNISGAIQRDGCMVTPVAYNIVVLRESSPVGKRKSGGAIEEEGSEENGTSNRIKVARTEADSCQGVEKGLKPGESVKFSLWVSSEYDLTTPGTYEITVTRETDRWNPEKSVTVKSNTITIVVPEPEAAAPK